MRAFLERWFYGAFIVLVAVRRCTFQSSRRPFRRGAGSGRRCGSWRPIAVAAVANASAPGENQSNHLIPVREYFPWIGSPQAPCTRPAATTAVKLGSGQRGVCCANASSARLKTDMAPGVASAGGCLGTGNQCAPVSRLTILRLAVPCWKSVRQLSCDVAIICNSVFMFFVLVATIPKPEIPTRTYGIRFDNPVVHDRHALDQLRGSESLTPP